jgi:hypothetical protein
MIRNALGLLAVAILSLCAVPSLGANNTAKSTDGHYEVYIQQIGAGDKDGNGSQAVILFDRKTGYKRALFFSRHHEDYTRNLTGLNTPLFSLDGSYVYINTTDPSPYRCAVQQINLQTGEVRFVTTGWALSLMRTGPYRGFLLVQKHVLYDRPQGGSYNPVFLMRPDGHRELMVPNSDNETGEEAVGPWLARRAWHAW